MTGRLSRWMVSVLLRRITIGSLVVVEGGERYVYGSGAPIATVRLRSSRVWPMLLRGSRGLAEAFAQGLWDSPDLVALIRLAARNAGRLDRLRARLAPVRWPLQRAAALLRPGTKRRARAQHLRALRPWQRFLRADARSDDDVLVRDLRAPGMTLERGPGGKARADLPEARPGPARSRARDRQRLGRVRAPRRQDPGCHVTTTTISREQHEYALERVRQAGLEIGSRCCWTTIATCAAVRQAGVDRDDRGGRLAAASAPSSPMLAAAGGRRADAAAGDHDRRPRLRGREGVEVVHERLHLPGRLPAVARGDRTRARQANDMQAAGLEDLTPHYAETLRRWRANFTANTAALAEVGYDERFGRIWGSTCVLRGRIRRAAHL